MMLRKKMLGLMLLAGLAITLVASTASAFPHGGHHGGHYRPVYRPSSHTPIYRPGCAPVYRPPIYRPGCHGPSIIIPSFGHGCHPW